ncbi:MAG: serine hydrolase domain-containing protein [Pseudomonadota bacterium]
MRTNQLICMAAVAAAVLPLHVLAADAAPSSTFAGKLDANQALATAAGTLVTGVKDWNVRREANMLVFDAPEHNASLAVIDLTAADGAAAIKAALAQFGGKHANLAPQSLNPAPARTGWDERVVASYDVPADQLTTVQASAYRHGASWTVVILDSADSTVGKRSAAISQMRASVVPADYTPESFAGRTPHRLDAPRVAQMRAFLAQAMQDAGVPGVGFALLEHGKIVYEGGVGVRELGKRTPVDANTLFMAASNTKGMSTLLLASLADQGKLRWDQPVTQLYPPFKLGSAEVTAQVLVKHLVCACTGLPRQDMEWLFEYRNTSALDSMAYLAKNSPTSGFGELYQYNNLMAAAAGFVGAHLVYPNMELGKAYDKAMQERIFTPLGMKATTFEMARALRANHASPHATGFDNQMQVVPMELNNAVYPHRPAGGVWTSAHDFIRYVQLEATGGKLPNGKQLVTRENLMMRRQPQVSSGKDKWYGMGLSTERTAGIDVLMHGGSLFGYKSNFFLIPESGYGAVILTNSNEGQLLLRPMLRRLLEVMYDGQAEAADDVKSAAASKARERTDFGKTIAMPADPAVIVQLGKHYRNAELGDVWIRADGQHALLDAGEWQSRIGTRKGDNGTLSLITTAAEFSGLELIIGQHEGKRALTLNDAQHAYRFDEVL